MAAAGAGVDAIADSSEPSDTVSLAGVVGADVEDCVGDDADSGTTVVDTVGVGDGVLSTTAVSSATDPVELGTAVTATSTSSSFAGGGVGDVVWANLVSSSTDPVGVGDVDWANPVSSATDPVEVGTAVTAASSPADGVGVGDVVWVIPVLSAASDDVGGSVWADTTDDGSSEMSANSKASAPMSK